MANETFIQAWRAVLLRCPLAGPFLAQQWVSFTFRRIAETRRWSWLTKRQQFLMPQVVNAGTALVTRAQNSVTGSGTAWDTSMIGRQFRVGNLSPIYTIADVPSTTSLTLDEPWGGSTASGVNYQIYQAYVTVPSDFHSFISVWDANFNWQLWLTLTQEELNSWDAQRANQGTAWAVVPYPYDDLTVSPPLPRYEVWPHQLSQYVYPFLYEARVQDLNENGATLPRYIRGDVLLEGALEQAAMWPGPSAAQPNPYFNLDLARGHEARFLKQLYEMERNDDEIAETDVRYAQFSTGLPFAALPFGDSAWLQSHAI